MAFNTISQKMLDAWLNAANPKPEELYGDVINSLSVRMRLSIIEVSSKESGDWYLRPIRQTKISSRILNLNSIFKNGRLGDFKDQEYLQKSVFPQYQYTIERKQPTIDSVETTLMGVRVTYDRIILPEKSKERPNWLVVCTYGRFMASTPAQNLNLDNIDEAILLHVMAGESAKEIAVHMNLSPRTIEHRLERLRKQVGARSLPHLVAMLVTAGFNRSITFTADGSNLAESSEPSDTLS
jgi:hypothetical protein